MALQAQTLIVPLPPSQGGGWQVLHPTSTPGMFVRGRRIPPTAPGRTGMGAFGDWGGGLGEAEEDDPEWWQVLIPTAGSTLSTIFARWPQGAAAQYAANPLNLPVYTVPQTTGIGIGVDSRGLRLSDGSYVGWGTIAVVVVGFMLLQSKGFSRR